MKQKMLHELRRGGWIPLVLFAISVACRLISTAGSNIIPGTGSMYYPLQVRCLLERGTPGYPDMPLVFWIEAIAAKLILLISNQPAGNSIVLACRIVNVVVPSLIVFPVFLLARSVSNSRMHPAYMAVILALSVLNPTVLVLFSIDFDKNVIGMLFVFLALYYLWQCTSQPGIRPAMLTLLAVILTLLTHFGCFSALFLFLLIFMLTMGLFHFRSLATWMKASGARARGVIFLIAALIFLPAAVALFDPQRYLHFTSFLVSPGEIFTNSLFISMLHGKFVYDGPNLFYLGIINAFSLLSAFTWFRLRKRLEKHESAFLLSVVIWLVSLSNPFINTAIYNRLLFISMIPLTAVMIFLFHHGAKPVKITVAVILSLLLLLTVATSGPRGTFISREEYLEMKEIGKTIPDPATVIVLAQHRVEFWVSWTLRVKSGQLTGIRPDEYRKYSQVLYLSQKNNRFREEVPKEARLIHAGRHFDLYRIN
jgi:hypothetical protein